MLHSTGGRTPLYNQFQKTTNNPIARVLLRRQDPTTEREINLQEKADRSRTNKEDIRFYHAHMVSGLRVASSSPRLGVSPAGDDSGIGTTLRLSICKTRLVPPASAESTQTGLLDPTVQSLDPFDYGCWLARKGNIGSNLRIVINKSKKHQTQG